MATIEELKAQVAAEKAAKREATALRKKISALKLTGLQKQALEQLAMGANYRVVDNWAKSFTCRMFSAQGCTLWGYERREMFHKLAENGLIKFVDYGKQGELWEISEWGRQVDQLVKG